MAVQGRNRVPTAARRLSLGAAVLSLLLLSSCSYLKDRGMDFLDQFRAVAGASTGAGIRSANFGLWNTGLLFGIKPQDTSFGVKYGRPIVFSATTTNAEFEADPSWLLFTTTLENCNFAGGSYKLARKSFGALPVLFTWADTTYRNEERWYVPPEGVDLEGGSYLWSRKSWKHNRYAIIHAFDSEIELSMILYLDLGYSPGELLDFLLGIVTIDLAGDDGRLSGGKR